MSQIPDLTDSRYLDEIGWFLYHEKYGRNQFGGSYNAERVAYSRLLLNEVLTYLEQDAKWLADKTVLSIGCGCTADLTTFPAAMKVAIDPLLSVYQKLGLLMADEAGGQTVYLSLGADNLPLLDDFADLIICRNALDHMPEPGTALKQISRILKPDGAFFLSVDIGGEPTPDEPTVFSQESLLSLVDEMFYLTTPPDRTVPHSRNRPGRIRFMARSKKTSGKARLEKDAILEAYMARNIPDPTEDSKT